MQIPKEGQSLVKLIRVTDKKVVATCIEKRKGRIYMRGKVRKL